VARIRRFVNVFLGDIRSGVTIVAEIEGLVFSVVIHSASAYPRLQARVKRTIAYTSTDDGKAGFSTVYDSFNTPHRHSV